ncbi:MAG: hypothetical protein GY953_20975, partial [bacterium]|nr:hypothetical protein [bacterium]
PAVSASGTRLVYARPAEEEGGSVWKVALQPATPAEAAPPGLLAFSASNPTFSPAGKRIAYSSGDAGRPNICISDADGKNPAPLTSVPTYAASPRWSPDGSFIAFDSVHEGDWDVYVISSDGGEPSKLTAHAGEDVRPSWSRDGEWIYFGSDRSGTAQLWKVPAGGGEALQVTWHGGYESVESPDGKYVYYTRRGVPGLWRTPAAGGEEILILEQLEWKHSRNWAVTDEGIYFLTCKEGLPAERECVANIFDVDTRSVTPAVSLGTLSLVDLGCSVSFDGRWLLYVREEQTETDIAMIEDFR